MGKLIEFDSTIKPKVIQPSKEVKVSDPTSPQEQIAHQFIQDISDIEDFVILAHTKDNTLKIYPCVEGTIGLLPFIDVFRNESIIATTKLLTNSNELA
jgi:hypothetical protein